MIALSLLTLVSATAVAQEDLITDRPDFTESANSVDRGVWQIETGVA